MLFRNPIAWVGLAALLVPVAIHLLVRAPARPIVLASLRFVPASPMQALRQRLLNDPGLLVLRACILALAAAALANPLLSTACRRQAWNGRIARAIVLDARDGASLGSRIEELSRAFASRQIAATDLRQGLAEAIGWLEAAPPAQREVVLVGALRLGSLDAADIAGIPDDVGVRFVRTAGRVTRREIAGPLITRRVEHGFVVARPRISIEAARTVAVTTPTPDALAIEDTTSGIAIPALAFQLNGPPHSRLALRAAASAALTVGVPVPDDARRPLVMIVGDPEQQGPSPSGSERANWIGDAIARIAADAEVMAEARGVRASSPRPLSDTWTALVRDEVGRVVVAAARGGIARRAPGPSGASRESGALPALLLLVQANARSSLVPALVRSALHAREPDRQLALRNAETLGIPDAELAGWGRPPRDVDPSLRGHTISDRRWAWSGVLVLLGIETLWRRRPRRTGVEEDESRVRAA